MLYHDEILDEIKSIEASFSGELSMSATNLRTQERSQFNADTPFPVAGVIGPPILVALLRIVEKGNVALGGPIKMRNEDRVPGPGVLKSPAGEVAHQVFVRVAEEVVAFATRTAEVEVLEY